MHNEAIDQRGVEETHGPEYQELYRETREVIDRLDMAMLEDIVAEKLRRAGIKKTRHVLWEKGRVVLIEPERADELPAGQCNLADQIIKINPRKLMRQLTDLQPEDSFRSAALSTLLHEEGHAIANLSYRPLSCEAAIYSLRNSVFLPYVQTGYHRRERKGITNKKLFNSFNEAVNDKIAEEIFHEYIRRTGESAVYGRSDRPARYFKGYYFERILLEQFMKKLADAAGVNKERVWEAIEGHNLRGDDLRTRELAMIFVEQFGESFFQQIVELANTPDAIALTEQFFPDAYKDPELDPQELKHRRKWLEKFLGESAQQA